MGRGAASDAGTPEEAVGVEAPVMGIGVCLAWLVSVAIKDGQSNDDALASCPLRWHSHVMPPMTRFSFFSADGPAWPDGRGGGQGLDGLMKGRETRGGV